MRSQLLFVVAVAVVARAQTITTVDGFGNTVVEVLTTDAFGDTLTSTIETLVTAITNPVIATTATTTALTTTTTSAAVAAVTTATTTGQQGPVGQPASTTAVYTPGAPTPYTYTTVINGVTTAIADVFTPTNPVTLPPSIGASGTILDYSSWLAEFGPTTTASAGANGASGGLGRSDLASCLALGLAMGMALVLR